MVGTLGSPSIVTILGGSRVSIVDSLAVFGGDTLRTWEGLTVENFDYKAEAERLRVLVDAYRADLWQAVSDAKSLARDHERALVREATLLDENDDLRSRLAEAHDRRIHAEDGCVRWGEAASKHWEARRKAESRLRSTVALVAQCEVAVFHQGVAVGMVSDGSASADDVCGEASKALLNVASRLREAVRDMGSY